MAFASYTGRLEKKPEISREASFYESKVNNGPNKSVKPARLHLPFMHASPPCLLSVPPPGGLTRLGSLSCSPLSRQTRDGTDQPAALPPRENLHVLFSLSPVSWHGIRDALIMLWMSGFSLRQSQDPRSTCLCHPRADLTLLGGSEKLHGMAIEVKRT